MGTFCKDEAMSCGMNVILWRGAEMLLGEVGALDSTGTAFGEVGTMPEQADVDIMILVSTDADPLLFGMSSATFSADAEEAEGEWDFGTTDLLLVAETGVWEMTSLGTGGGEAIWVCCQDP